MNNNLVKEITLSQLRDDIPEFSSGDVVKVYLRIIENKKERLQVFQGVVVAVVLVKHLQLEKFLAVSVLKKHSYFTHHQLVKLKLSVMVKLEEIKSSIYVIEVVNPLVLKKYLNSKNGGNTVFSFIF